MDILPGQGVLMRASQCEDGLICPVTPLQPHSCTSPVSLVSVLGGMGKVCTKQQWALAGVDSAISGSWHGHEYRKQALA